MTLLCRAPRSGPPKTRSRVGFSEGSPAGGANDAISSARHKFSLASSKDDASAWYAPDQLIADQRRTEGANIVENSTSRLMGERSNEGIVPAVACNHKMTQDQSLTAFAEGKN